MREIRCPTQAPTECGNCASDGHDGGAVLHGDDLAEIAKRGLRGRSLQRPEAPAGRDNDRTRLG
jgi:hypothetical protein